MFEVYAERANGTQETYDALTETQAECIFFRLRMDSTVTYVEINELVDIEDAVA
jgi:hypothetical protein